MLGAQFSTIIIDILHIHITYFGYSLPNDLLSSSYIDEFRDIVLMCIFQERYRTLEP